MDISNALKELKLKCLRESLERDKLRETPEYMEAQKKLEELRIFENDLLEYQKSIIEQIPDSSAELELLKQQAIEQMKAQGLESIGDIEAKFRVKKEVNTRKLMDALQGDLDNFFLLAKVQQNTLKDFTKSNPQYKGIEKECVDEIGREIVDISIPIE